MPDGDMPDGDMPDFCLSLPFQQRYFKVDPCAPLPYLLERSRVKTVATVISKPRAYCSRYTVCKVDFCATVSRSVTGL